MVTITIDSNGYIHFDHGRRGVAGPDMTAQSVLALADRQSLPEKKYLEVRRKGNNIIFQFNKPTVFGQRVPNGRVVKPRAWFEAWVKKNLQGA